MAAPTFVAAGTFSAVATGTTLGPVNIPAGAQANDIMVLAVMMNAGGTFTTPSGWTQFGTALNSSFQSTNWFWKRHTGSESGPSTTTSVSMSASNGGYARIYIFRGCITTGSPFEGVANAGSPTTSTTPTTSAVTTTDVDRLAVAIAMVDDDPAWSSGMPPAGASNIGGRVSSTTGGDGMFDAISSTAATAQTIAATSMGTMSLAAYWRTMSFALIPAPAVAIPNVTGTATSGLATSGSFTLSLPSGSPTGYLAVGAWHGAQTDVTPGSGWTLLSSGINSNATDQPWTRWAIWTATSPGTSWSTITTDGTAIVVVGYDGVISAAQLTTTSATTDLTIPTSPTVTTTTVSLALRILVGNIYGSDETITYPTAATLGRAYAEVPSATGDRFIAAVAHESRASAGATGTATWTIGSATAYYLTAHTLILTTTGGSPDISRTATGTLSLAGVGGTTDVSRTATGALSLSGTATQIVSVTRTATGTLTLSGTGSIFRYVTAVSADGRTLVDQSGTPFLVRGDSPWGLFQNVSVATAKSYLDFMAANGLNTALTQFLGDTGSGATNAFAGYDGTAAFTNVNDWDTINEAYWSRVDQVVAYAQTKGITLFINPVFHQTGNGGIVKLQTQSTTKQTNFGTFIGTRYGSYPNVVFVAGGDWEQTYWNSTYLDIWTRVINAARAVAPQRLWTVHLMSTGGYSSLSSSYAAAGALADFEFAYAYNAAYKILRGTEAQATTKPVIFGEGNYDGENNTAGPSTTAETLRRTAGWSYSSGAQGDIQGTSYWSVTGAWSSNLPTTGQTHVGKMRDAVSATPWWKLRFSTSFITAGAGTDPSSGTMNGGGVDPLESSYATASVAADGTAAVVYVPTSRAFTVDLSKLGANSRTATRVDPTTGTSTPLTVTSSYSDAGNNASGSSDWLYIFTAAASDVTVTATGTLTLTGTAARTAELTRTATGSLTLAGSTAQTAEVTRTAAGTLTLAGTAPRTVEATRTATGSLTLAGSTSVILEVSRTATGALPLGGTATRTAELTRTATGTVALAGSAVVAGELTRTATGTLSLAGNGSLVVDVSRTATGLLSLSGAAAGAGELSRTGTGTLALVGQTSSSIEAARSATGTLTLDGSGAVSGEVERTATGGLTLSGTAARTISVVTTAAGSVTLSGAASRGIETAQEATGDLSLNGSATFTLEVSRTAQAVLSLEGIGDFSANGVLYREANVELTLSGTAAVQTELTRTATGQLSLGGSADFTVGQDLSRTAVGQLTLSGAASITTEEHLTRTATGSLNLSGTATATVTAVISRLAVGELIITADSSSVTEIWTDAVGQLTLAGSATWYNPSVPPIPTSRLRLSLKTGMYFLDVRSEKISITTLRSQNYTLTVTTEP